MFRWYQNSAKCYVYLSDVSGPHPGSSNTLDSLAFRKSRWFSRGWTLQELIAPISVEFFSLEHDRLGDKRSLEQQIHDITGIHTTALRGWPLSRFSVDDRFRWARRRDTTRSEDWAYSLLGVFNTFMPLIYGEGRDHAIVRLERQINEVSKSKYPKT